MSRKRQLQTTFIAGELDAKLALRVDTKQYSNGAKSLLNRRCLIGGGTARRPGTRKLTPLTGGNNRLIEFVFNENEQYILAFMWDPSIGSGGMAAYFPSGASAGGIGFGHPWTGPVIAEMDFMQTGNTIIVTHHSFPPQVITRTGPTTWTNTPFQFFPNGPRLEQPYFKIAPPTMTMNASSTTGTVQLSLSGNYFQAGHVGQRFRYLGRELVISSIIDPSNAMAVVNETLPETLQLGLEVVAPGVPGVNNFTVGESVIGADSTAKGVVSSIDPGTGTIQVYLRSANIASPTGPGGSIDPIARIAPGFGGGLAQSSLQRFIVGETLVGPAGTAKISSVNQVTILAAVTDWDEALFTPHNGFPSCIALHRNRLCFAGHPKAPSLLMASRIGNFYSFNVGDGSDADAILVTIGDAAAAEIRQLFSSDQLLLGTDKGLYYVPESLNSPFTPSRMSFIAFGSPWPISGSAKMRAFDDGVIAVSASTVIKARGTGDSSKTWTATEMSILSPHLLNQPYDIAVTTNFEGGPERYCVFTNIDGTLTIMMLVETQDIRNFVPWRTAGLFDSVCVINKRLYVAARRFDVFSQQLEIFENTLTLDGVITINTTPELPNIPFMFPGLTINVVTTSGFSLGVWPLAMDDIPPGPYHCGQNYPTVVQTLPAVLEDARGSSAGEMAKINEAQVFTHESCRFAGNGYEKTAYRINEDANLPPPKRTGAQRLKFLGWRVDPTLTITDPDPLPLTILGIKTEVFW